MVAAVSGFALGGGCELALLCDMIVASETAEFGQPEITLGIIPGGGGTQRLARVIGKQRAMELVLTGRRFDAAEAAAAGPRQRGRRQGRVARPALELAQTDRRAPADRRPARQAGRARRRGDRARAPASSSERRLYELAMATEDRVEGMEAFLEKREPKFRGDE